MWGSIKWLCHFNEIWFVSCYTVTFYFISKSYWLNKITGKKETKCDSVNLTHIPKEDHIPTEQVAAIKKGLSCTISSRERQIWNCRPRFGYVSSVFVAVFRWGQVREMQPSTEVVKYVVFWWHVINAFHGSTDSLQIKTYMCNCFYRKYFLHTV
jgi:hypothetical protein